MNSRFAIGAMFVLVLLVGCGPGSDMGYVSGKVTLDDEPVGYATVNFYQEGVRPSIGSTDADGNYELSYTRAKMGAMIGQHKVTITQENPNQGLGEGDVAVEDFVAVKIPRKYTDPEKTELTETVEQGSNEINFELKTE